MATLEDAIARYVAALDEQYQTGIAIEHAYRPALKALLGEIIPGTTPVNDPKHSEHGAPDFAIVRGKIPLGYAEAKDIGIDLDAVVKSDQMRRYFGYKNLILTDYLEFRFYRDGAQYEESITVAKVSDGRIVPVDTTAKLAHVTLELMEGAPEPIRSANRLAEIMGGKARRIRDNVIRYLEGDSERNREFRQMLEVFRDRLVHTITPAQFADMYAQTLVYGLFAARYADRTPDNFSRQEARDLVPHSNPLLREFFDHIAGAGFDERLTIIVDELCEVFTHAAVHELIERAYRQDAKIGETKESRDPIIHFYEDFLKEYDPAQRVQLGVFYTPPAVVSFIVRSIDRILQERFALPRGLADESMIEAKLPTQGIDKRTKGEVKYETRQVHRVEILDPATGTGTFLNQVIRHIHAAYFEGNEGAWQPYVSAHLLPRLFGFELLMASYTIAHLKLAMTLAETGYTDERTRLGIYLTNTLDEPIDTIPRLAFGLDQAITDEAYQASRIKKDLPIMVVLGNPPYSGISSNPQYRGNADYKKEPGTNEKLNERKNWLDDDYVKFIHFAESLIRKNGEGIVGMITAHGYLDNPTFRGMRYRLLETFDEIYVLDLHGNANKKEKAADGTKDENVFDIKTGTAILLGIRGKKEGKGERKELADVYHAEMLGTRLSKYERLNQSDWASVSWQKLEPAHDRYYFVPVAEGDDEYEQGIAVNDIFDVGVTGIVTARDSVVIDTDKDVLRARIDMFCDPELSDDEVRRKLFPGKKDGKYKAGDTRGWKLDAARKKIRDKDHDAAIKPIAYRPFDTRWVYYDPDMVDWGREKIMNRILKGKNLYLVVHKREELKIPFAHALVTDLMTEHGVTSGKTTNYQFPLYLYPEQQTTDDTRRTPNLKTDAIKQFEDATDLAFEPENCGGGATICPYDILDYIYAVLYSPSYRAKYGEFLKRDFPRVPLPSSAEQFRALAGKGSELRQLHLLTHPVLARPVATFPVLGDSVVGAKFPTFENGRVRINDTQYFDGIPKEVWEFYIGGYQPAQKWLKDRRGRTLTYDDIEHYRRFTTALQETIRVMGDVDSILASSGN
ncbi:MAG TPA: type ISP restriction/modification enzyme [Candidatus Paceibacterota bacterium]|nr:type ISP restriction/modification enzyme [Candidatus Paceibacterota bacterium]